MNNDILKNFLNVFWLRPETALWRAVDVMVMEELEFNSPVLDLGCGDGIFSFIRAGGEFDISYDMFQSVSNVDNFFNNIDVYNYYDENKIHPNIIKKPRYLIDVGLDHKEALLNKSSKLGLYKKLVQHDANKQLPFEDNSFKTIFSNIIYWLEDPKQVLKECQRILMPGGKLIIMLPNETFLNYSFFYRLYLQTQNNEWKWLEKIDRGRVADNIKHAYSNEKWEEIFNEAELKVISHKQHLSKTIIEAWDIGLRPLFPVLYKMVSKLDDDSRHEIKREWISLVYDLIEPMCKEEWVTDKEFPPAFHNYVLTK